LRFLVVSRIRATLAAAGLAAFGLTMFLGEVADARPSKCFGKKINTVAIFPARSGPDDRGQAFLGFEPRVNRGHGRAAGPHSRGYPAGRRLKAQGRKRSLLGREGRDVAVLNSRNGDQATVTTGAGGRKNRVIAEH
jgi:hypothetical protein